MNMLKVFRSCFLLATVGCLLMAQPLMADEEMKGNLLSTNWLEKNLKNSDLVLLDASPESYKANHIPGAVSVNIYELFAYGFGGRAPAEAERLFQSWGISPGKKIVLYDSGGTNLATRL